MRYNVWSRVGNHWLVVDEGTKGQAKASVRRKTAAAAKVMPDGDTEFVMLPEGEIPEPTRASVLDLDALVKEAERGYCVEYARRGTGHGICGRPLDERGECDRAGDHEEAP